MKYRIFGHTLIFSISIAVATILPFSAEGAFSANPTNIAPGQSVTLSWNVQTNVSASNCRATGLSLGSPTFVSVVPGYSLPGYDYWRYEGSVTVNPSVTTTYSVSCDYDYSIIGCIPMYIGDPCDVSGGGFTTTTESQTVTVSAPATGSMSASPNPCTAGSIGGTCTSNISWSTTNATNAQVWVSQNGGSESFFAASTGGTVGAPWISVGSFYVFRLYNYSSGTRGEQLSSVTVTANNPLMPNLTAGTTANASYNPSGSLWLIAGTPTTFSATVSNTGNALATNFPNVFQIADYNLTTTLAMVAGQTHTLGAGGSTSITGTYTFATPATYKVRACSNYNTSWGGSVSESSTADNCGAWSDYAVQTQPNLTATVGAAVTGTTDTAVTLSGTISNTGNGSSGASFSNIVQVCDNACATYNTDTTLTSTSGTLAAGGSVATSRSVTLPATSGTYYYRWCADYGSGWATTITESNESDNCSSWQTITVSPPALPNLTAGTTANASYNPSGSLWLIAGTPTTFSATVSNTGNALATNFPNVFQIADYNLTTTLAMVAGQTHTLGAGGSTSITGTYTFATPATYKVRACSNYNTSWGGSVSESSTADNCGAWSDYLVTPGAPTGLSYSCDASAVATLSWTAPSGGSSGYYVRVTPTNGGACPANWQLVNWGGELCIPNPDSVSGTSILFGALIGQSYNWWVHGKSTSGEWSPATHGTFSCAGSPDLTADAYTNTTATAGVATTLGVGASNIGNATATNFPNIFQIATNASFTSGEFRVSANNGTLTAGQSGAISTSYTFNTPGTYYIRGCVDNNTSWGGIISESNEGNNCGIAGTIIVSNPTPTADLTASPTTVATGNASTLSWSSTNAASCTGTGFSTGGATSGSVSTGPLTTTSNYQVTCGSASDTASVSVTNPTADITVTPDRVNTGGASSVSWTSSQVASCTVTGTNGFSQSGLSGTSVSTGAISAQTTFSISCDGGVATDLVIVNIVPRFEEF